MRDVTGERAASNAQGGLEEQVFIGSGDENVAVGLHQRRNLRGKAGTISRARCRAAWRGGDWRTRQAPQD